jgi:hypothetical protein
MRKTFILAALAALSACQSVPPATTGPVTIPGPYRAAAAIAVRNYLKDPYSVRDARISEPTMLSGLMIGGTKPGVCVTLNAKNGFGAYVGVQSFTIPFQGATPIAVFEGYCPDMRWTPFRELNG